MRDPGNEVAANSVGVTFSHNQQQRSLYHGLKWGGASMFESYVLCKAAM